MKKLLIIIIAITGLFILAFEMGWIKEADIHDQIDLVHDLVEHDESALSSNTLTQYVPADTVVYMGGQLDPDMYAFMADYPIFQLSASDRAHFSGIYNEFIDEDSSAAKFINALMRDYAQHVVDGNLSQFMQHYGLADSGEYAMYMHGLVPVINMPMHDVSKLKRVFANASEQAGFDYETVKINEADVMRWTLNNSALQVVLATTDASAVLTLAMPQDDENIIKERLAQSPVANPITQTVQAIGQQYDYTDDMVSLFSFEQLVKGLYKADDSTLSKDIARYVPASIYDEYFGMTSEAAVCKNDIIGLVSAAPRMVMGYHDISFSEQALSTKAHGVWELTSPVVKKALQQMQGVMAAHTTEFNDQIFSLGLAWDMSQLASASTTLWQAFLDNKFTCEPLQQAQEELKQVSPMMLGMVTGFAQGLKGIGLSLYDLTFDPNFAVQPSLDVALTVEAENPSNLLSLLQMMPETAHITVPNDGSVVPIDLGLPFDLKIQATIQGQHLVFFSGEKGAHIAQTIGSETLKANALGGGGVFNYKKLADVIDKNDLASLGGSSEVCMETYAFIDQMQNLDMDIASHGKASNHGYEFTMNTVMRKPFETTHAIDVTGTWQAAYLDETCQWIDVGIEKLESNGTGAYVELSEGGECELYKTAYDWTQQGATIVMKDSESAVSRDNCAQEWIEEGGEATFICEMMQVKTDSFMCIYHGDGEEPFVYRYSR